jgi:hypothetical protein
MTGNSANGNSHITRSLATLSVTVGKGTNPLLCQHPFDPWGLFLCRRSGYGRKWSQTQFAASFDSNRRNWRVWVCQHRDLNAASPRRFDVLVHKVNNFRPISCQRRHGTLQDVDSHLQILLSHQNLAILLACRLEWSPFLISKAGINHAKRQTNSFGTRILLQRGVRVLPRRKGSPHLPFLAGHPGRLRSCASPCLPDMPRLHRLEASKGL